MLRPLSSADDWFDLEAVTYLYTGAHAPALRVAAQAVEAACRQQSQGPLGRQHLYQAERTARSGIAQLAGVAVEDVAFVGNASTAWNLVANGLTWIPGDNVVLNELEHPSVSYPFLRLKAHGLEVRVVQKDDRWRITPEAITAACDDRTRAIAVSHVAYVNGFRHDIAALADVADRAGVPLFVDWSHSLGVLPVDMRGCAIGISASYKWLIGPYGVGIVLWNRERMPDFLPGGAGWRSTNDFFTEDRFDHVTLSPDARRFQLGAPSFSSIAGLRASVEHLQKFGVPALERHALTLSGLCRRGLADLGLTVITPEQASARAGSIAFLHPDSETITRQLQKRGIYVWGGDGRVRASFHLMNDDLAVETYLKTLTEILPTLHQ